MKICSNFELPDRIDTQVGHYNNLSGLNFTGLKNMLRIIVKESPQAILHANPKTGDLLALGLIKLIKPKIPIFLFDLILKNPDQKGPSLIVKVKKQLLSNIDYIIAIHKDTSGYSKYYGIKKEKFLFVPFKANNYKLKDQFFSEDKGYVLSYGASYRDYATLISAVKNIPYKLKIVCTKQAAIDHGAILGNDFDTTPNVDLIDKKLSTSELYELVSKCTFMVVPIQKIAIQPAGISVLLEAMILKKAVIISAGASSNGLVTHMENAIVVPPEDVQALNKAIKQLLDDQPLRQQIELAGYNYADSLADDKRMREQLLTTIISTVNEKNPTQQ